MGIGQYGLKDPHRCSLEDFDYGDEYVVGIFDNRDRFLCCWSRVVRSDDEVVFDVLSSEHKCQSIRIDKDRREAIIEDQVVEVVMIGYYRLYGTDDLLIFGGDKYGEDCSKVYIRSPSTAKSKSFDTDQLIQIETSYEISEIKFVSFKNRNSAHVQSGLEYSHIQELTCENDSWLEVGLQLDSLNLFNFESEGSIKMASFD